MTTRSTQLLAMVAATTTALAGCGPGATEDEAWAEEAIEAVENTFTESTFALSAGDGLLGVGPNRANAAAQVAVARANVAYLPSGCATATADGATVRYVFRGCRNLAGAGPINGALEVAYEAPAGTLLRATLTSTALGVGAASLNLNTVVTYTASDRMVSAAVVTRTQASGDRGLRLARQGNYTLLWQPAAQCLTLDGTWSTTVGAIAATTEVSGLRRCMGRCPQPGGQIVHRRPNGVTVTLSFVGGEIIQWATTRNRRGTLSLFCQN